jgi:hypothetical protein
MKILLNFLAFLLLMTYAINQGDLFGMVVSSIGFLIMHAFLEDLQDAE